MHEKCKAIHIKYCKTFPGLYRQSTDFNIVKIKVFSPTDNKMLVPLSKKINK